MLVELRTTLSEHSHYLSSEQRALPTVKSNHIMALRIDSDRVFKLNKLSVKIDAIEECIKNYDTKANLITTVEGLIEKKQSLNGTMLELSEQIKDNKAQTNSHRESIESNLSEKTVELLKKDRGFESAFNVAQAVMFDFGKDFMLVDERSKFSASSEAVLKNSFHLATLLESLEDDSMRYPRLFLLDNTEDKGMGPDRSQNFQRILVEALAEHNDKPFQVIMTTSMVDPGLDTSDLCVELHYAKGMHTLNI